MSGMTIGQVARAAEVGVETVRFYERQGLLAEPPRRASGYRMFPPEAVRRLRFIRRAKSLGFSLKDIKGLMDLRLDPEATCADIKRRASEKIAEMEQKITSLEKMKQALGCLVSDCDSKGKRRTEECPILNSLDREG